MDGEPVTDASGDAVNAANVEETNPLPADQIAANSHRVR